MNFTIIIIIIVTKFWGHFFSICGPLGHHEVSCCIKYINPEPTNIVNKVITTYCLKDSPVIKGCPPYYHCNHPPAPQNKLLLILITYWY